MKSLVQFLKTTLFGGLVIVLPVWLAIFLLLRAVKSAIAMLHPLTNLLPQSLVHPDLAALGLLLVISFLAGLFFRTGPGLRFRAWMARKVFAYIPGFSMLRSVFRQLSGDESEQAFEPALAEMGDALIPAFIVERHTDGHCTVFISSSPAPLAGSIHILPPERVHPVEVPFGKAMICISKWGAGAAEMRAAIRPPLATAEPPSVTRA